MSSKPESQILAIGALEPKSEVDLHICGFHRPWIAFLAGVRPEHEGLAERDRGAPFLGVHTVAKANCLLQ